MATIQAAVSYKLVSYMRVLTVYRVFEVNKKGAERPWQQRIAYSKSILSLMKLKFNSSQ